MKSFSPDQSLSLIHISKSLKDLQGHRFQQINKPQKIGTAFFKDFEKNRKELLIISNDHKKFKTRMISFNEHELVLRLPESIKIELNDRLIIVFPTTAHEYIVQTFVRQVFSPMVVLSYADPRIEKRWVLKKKKSVTLSPVPESLIKMFIEETCQLVRLTDIIRPEPTITPKYEIDLGGEVSYFDYDSGGQVSLKEDPTARGALSVKKNVRSKTDNEKESNAHTVYRLEDMICSDVQTMPDPGGGNKRELLVTRYQKQASLHDQLSSNRIIGTISDISYCGIGVLLKKSNEIVSGSLLYIEPDSFFQDEKSSESEEFKIRLFGIVRYLKPVRDGESEVVGIKFIKPNKDPRFLNLLSKISARFQ